MHVILSKKFSQSKAAHHTDNSVQKSRARVMDDVFL